MTDNAAQRRRDLALWLIAGSLCLQAAIEAGWTIAQLLGAT